MTAVSETDIKELQELINNRFEQLNSDTKQLDGKIDEIKVSVAKLEVKVNSVEQHLTSIERQVNSQTNWFIGLFSILVSGLLGILGKIALFTSS
jgi:cell division septum initiation protein DivIVA